MKKIFLAATIAVALSAGITTQSKAQAKAVNIENFAAPISAKENTPLTETMFYNKAGKLEYVVKRYQQNELPKNISRLVRNQFYDFDIIGVEEVIVASNNNSVYFVHIANNKKLATVKVTNGETEIVNEYNNANVQ